jgi:hypothetical protein
VSEEGEGKGARIDIRPRVGRELLLGEGAFVCRRVTTPAPVGTWHPIIATKILC